MLKRYVMAVAVLALGACAAPPPKVTQTNLEIQAYQTREFEASKRQAFDATMSVLQDAGYIIESADFETGFITGKGNTNAKYEFLYGPVNEGTKMTATVQERGSAVASVRINIVETRQRRSVWNEMQAVINEDGVRDPVVYQKLFEQVDKTIFVLKGVN